jgi:IS30 family transposase
MRRPYRKLTLDERRVLATMLQAKVPKTKIAETLGKDRSTSHREIKRNWWHDSEVPQADGCWHITAQMMSDERRTRLRKLERLTDLRQEVITKLKDGWSPEQIAGRLKIEPRAPCRICHETIYQYVYSDSGQSQELGRYLPERQKKRKPRYARKARDRVFPFETSIHNRPKEINDRSQFGNCEGDLMIFERAQDNANVATLIERKTRYTMLLRNNDRKSRPLMNKLINEMSPLPVDARRSITFDRGFEFTSWRELHKGMGTKSWFCDPQAPWQKGSVENMNKRVRRYLPRDTALLPLPNRYIRSICERLNATPRKCSGYRTPSEVFRDELMKPERR